MGFRPENQVTGLRAGARGIRTAGPSPVTPVKRDDVLRVTPLVDFRPFSSVTLACVDALLDRLVNPPMLDTEYPEVGDVDGAARMLIRLVTEEAERLRELIRSHPPPDDPT
jgi:hypothetical protein